MLRPVTLLLLTTLFFPALARAQPCQHEEALGELAVELVLAATLDGDTVQSALHASGSDLPHVRVTRDVDTLRQLAESADAPLVCGRAQGRQGPLWVAAPRGGSLTAREDGLEVGLHPDFTDAYLAFVGAAGEAAERGVRYEVRAGAFVAWPDLPRPITAQLIATGPQGPRPVAERVLGGDLRRSARLQSDAPLTVRIERLREEVGASPLRDNRLLREEATAHARRLCREGRASHLDGEGRDPEQRLRRRGVVARVVGETVARAVDEERAFAALLESPSHRLTLIDRRFTDLGIGTAERDGHTCVVIEFAAWPRYQP